MDNHQLGMAQARKAIDRIVKRWGQGVEFQFSSIESMSSIEILPAKTVLQRRGDYVSASYLVLSGILRFYYTTENGRELNKCFYGVGDFAGDFSASFLDTPSRFSIETVEPCLLLKLSVEKFRTQVEKDPGIKFLAEQAMNTLMVRNERREEDFLTLSSKERFLKFIESFPTYLDRIPQKHIASYLGITPESLSTYKKKWLADSKP